MTSHQQANDKKKPIEQVTDLNESTALWRITKTVLSRLRPLQRWFLSLLRPSSFFCRRSPRVVIDGKFSTGWYVLRSDEGYVRHASLFQQRRARVDG